jgi:hypothetical protein
LVSARRPSLRTSRCWGRARGARGRRRARPPAGRAAEAGRADPWQVKGAPAAVDDAAAAAVLAAAAPFQNGYLGAALARMTDAVAAAFPGGARALPTSAELQKCIGRAPPPLRPPPRRTWASARAREHTSPGASACVAGGPRGRRANGLQTCAAVRRPPRPCGERGERGDCAPALAKRREPNNAAAPARRRLHEELKAAGDSPRLAVQVAACAGKALRLLADKAEYMTATGARRRRLYPPLPQP